MARGTLTLAAQLPNSPVATLIGTKIGLSSDFNAQTGSSVACPHASGIAALLKGAHLMTTDDALDNTQNTTQRHGPQL